MAWPPQTRGLCFCIESQHLLFPKKRIKAGGSFSRASGLLLYCGMMVTGSGKGRKIQFPEYDGSDISEACADQVNVHHHYVVLTDYLVYVDDTGKIYCVHKKTGEKREIPVDVEDRGRIKACNLCGYEEYLYLICDCVIYRAEISEKELRFQSSGKETQRL